MLDGAARRAPRLSGDAQFSGLLRRAVAIFLANRLPMVAVRGFSRLQQGRPLCWRPRTAASLSQVSFKAQQVRLKAEASRPRQSPPTSNPLPRKHVVAAVRCRQIPHSIRHRIIYGLISFNIDEAEASHKTLYLQQYSPKKQRRKAATFN
jgi:hypothetical protein